MIRSKQSLFYLKYAGLFLKLLTVLSLALLSGCAGGGGQFRNAEMDFGSIQTIAVMPLQNLSKDSLAGERVKDIFITSLLATGAMYVLPPGEVARGIGGAGIANPTAPSPEEVIKLCKQLKIDGVITGTVREYGEVRSGSIAANVIAMSMQMFEGQTGKVVWSASTTQGGIGVVDRLFGGGGESMDIVTEKAVNDIINKLFQ
jgi:hypothetical protein